MSMQVPADIHDLREKLHELDAVLLEAPLWRIGTAWWVRRWEERLALRVMINRIDRGSKS